MKTTKIRQGVYRHINRFDETWILRGGTNYFDAGQRYWVANQCDTLLECFNHNSACSKFQSKKHAIEFLNTQF